MKGLLKKGSNITISGAARSVNVTPDCTNCFKLNNNNNNNRNHHQGHQTLLQGSLSDGAASKENTSIKKTIEDGQEIRTFYKKLLKHHKGVLVLGAIGVLLVGVATIIILVDPLAVISKTMLSFTKGSYLYRMWVKPPIVVHVKIYVFNVTNHEAFMKGEEKLRLQELGPFVYREVLEHNNVTFNDNNTVTYIPRRVITEMPELGLPGLTLQSRIIVPNIPLIGFASMLADSSYFLNLGLLSLTNYLDIQLFLNLTVEEYLWGYEEPLIRLASTIAPNWISFDKLGLLDRMFDDGTNVVTMSLNNEKRVNDLGRVINPVTIDQYNGSPGMKHWGYEDDDNTTHKTCNTLQGIASEGVFFQRGITPNDSFVIYRKAFCRTLRLVYDRAGVTENNLPAYWYKLPDDVFDNNNPENSCYCKSGKGPCLPQGLSDVTPCYYNIPAAVSLPHFYNSDPALLDNIEGLVPVKEKHATEVIMQPEIGIPLRVHSRIQTNIVVKNTKYHRRVAPFINMTVPIFWADLSLDEMPPSISNILELLLLVAPAVQMTAVATLYLAGIVMASVAVLKYSCGVQLFDVRKSQSHGRQVWGGDYTSVKIRTDLLDACAVTQT